MPLTLILMRHAKSSWATEGLGDHARPLNARGQRSAVALGAWLAKRGEVPDAVLSSDSQRTRETWAGVAQAFAQPPKPEWRRDLYHAAPGAMLEALLGAHGQTVLLLGHNPGCAFFAEAIVDAPPHHDRFDDYPTGATLVVRFMVGRWSEIGWKQGQVAEFVVPRELDA